MSRPGYLYEYETSIMSAHLKRVVFFYFFFLFGKKRQNTEHSIPRCSCTIQWFFWSCAVSLPLPFVLIYFPLEDEDPSCLPLSFWASPALFISLYLQADWNGRKRGGYFFPPVPGTCVCRMFFFLSSLSHFGNFPGILILISTKEVHGFYRNIMNPIRFSNTFNFII